MKRLSLYDQLPAIYKTEDAKQNPPFQLKDYLDSLDRVFSALSSDIQNLYSNMFIDTCDPWVIPYIGDLLGVSHLVGDEVSLRADVADTVKLRKSKGTVGAIETLARDLTGWTSHVVQVRENLAWCHNLNHMRPENFRGVSQHPRGGFLNLRSPKKLARWDGPWEQTSRLVDLKPRVTDQICYNLPHTAVFLRRSRLFYIHQADPGYVQVEKFNLDDGSSLAAIKIMVHPLSNPSVKRPLQIFSQLGALKWEDVSEWVEVNPSQSTQGLALFQANLDNNILWRVQGMDLCGWDQLENLNPQKGDLLVDPKIGRIVLIVEQDQALKYSQNIYLSYWINTPGDVGAVPVSLRKNPEEVNVKNFERVTVSRAQGKESLQTALINAAQNNKKTLIEISDSGTYYLDFSQITHSPEDGSESGMLQVSSSISIRAASDVRPTIKIKSPMGFRPRFLVAHKYGAPDSQEQIDIMNADLNLYFEGLLIGVDESFSGSSLINSFSLNCMVFSGCSLDPGGFRYPNGVRAEARTSMEFTKTFSFDTDEEILSLKQNPRVVLFHSITGRLRAGDRYEFKLIHSIVDGVDDLAVAHVSSEPPLSTSINSGPHLYLEGATFFGSVEVSSLNGKGGVFTDLVQVWDTQKGCLSHSTFRDEGSRLPRVHSCLKRTEMNRLLFTSRNYDSSGYGQLSRSCDYPILEQGPVRENGFGDQMGVFGYLFETQKWKNLEVRLREYSPVGSVILMIPITD